MPVSHRLDRLEGIPVADMPAMPEGTVFVLNDYRRDLSDSRKTGGIPLDSVQCKVIFVLCRRGI